MKDSENGKECPPGCGFLWKSVPVLAYDEIDGPWGVFLCRDLQSGFAVCRALWKTGALVKSTGLSDGKMKAAERGQWPMVDV